MSEDQTVSAEDTTSQSMADIANSIQVSDDVSQTEVQQQTADNVGDFKAFASEIAALKQQVEQTTLQTSELANTRQQEVLNKEIAEAVGKVSENLEGVKPKIIELHLDSYYQDNPAFKKVWDNRHSNPEALDAALVIAGREIAAEYPNAIDSSVAENQRALKESQKGGATVQVDSLHQELDKKDSGEFLQYAHTLAQGG